ncbi:MAG: CDGSH iron-sulfur domain-containing protein [Candidatus Nanopelagicales bacterium]
MNDDAQDFRIDIEEGGPYVVHGGPPMSQQFITSDTEGNSRGYRKGKEFSLPDKVRLCRCGQSNSKPYCDGSHKTADADLEETASFDPIAAGAQVIGGDGKDLTDNEKLCAYGRFCDVDGGVWNLVAEPGSAAETLVAGIVHHCPGGRLGLKDSTSGEILDEPIATGLELIEDPELGDLSGPLRATGGIRVVSASGKEYEVRDRQALCRCGASSNKPFCDGSHASVGFTDGI